MHKLASLLRQFYQFNAGTQSIDQATTSLTRIQLDIKSLEPEDCPLDRIKAIVLMYSFSKAYKTVNTILSSFDGLTFQSAVARLKEEEVSLKEKTKTVLAGAALATYNSSNNSQPATGNLAAGNSLDSCLKCGKQGHWAADCYTKPEN